jgi:hypothetical protein
MSYFTAAIVVALLIWLGRSWSASRARLERLAGQIVTLRESATADHTYRPPVAADGYPGADLPAFDQATTELRAAGFSILGDLVAVQAGRPPAGLTRWFADPEGRAAGWFGVARGSAGGAGAAVTVLLSESASGRFYSTTRGAPPVMLAPPPFVIRKNRPAGQAMDEVLAAHRAAIAADGAEWSALRRCEGLEDAVASFRRQQAAIAQWRSAQPAGTLLDADLRSILGPKHDALAPLVRPRVEGR